MTIKELRQQTGMSQSKFAEFLNISIKTIQNWEIDKRTPPEYVTELIEYKLRNEGLIGKKDTKIVYVVTEGEYSSYQIQALFSDYETAKKYCACRQREYYSPDIEVWELDGEEIQSNEKVFFQWSVEVNKHGEICSPPIQQYVFGSNTINAVKDAGGCYNIYFAIDKSITEKQALKIATDRLAIYKAKKEKI